MRAAALVLFMSLSFSELSAFSTSNIQYLYGKFDDNSLFDTVSSGKSTVTLEHYKVNKMYFDNSYQLSVNYLSNHIFDTPFVSEGFADWTKDELLTQNQLLYDLDKVSFLGEAKAYVGTQWHYYQVKDSDTRSSTWQIMRKIRW